MWKRIHHPRGVLPVADAKDQAKKRVKGVKPPKGKGSGRKRRWYEGQADGYYILESGGLGLTAPSGTLHVNGENRTFEEVKFAAFASGEY